ncbi:SWIM zinc finger family protein, partial [Georgenia sp.]
MIPEQDVRRLVGGGAFERGRQYAHSGHVVQMLASAGRTRIVGKVTGNGPSPYVVTVTLAADDAGLVRPVEGICTCPVGWNCKHVAALLLRAREELGTGGTGGTGGGWRSQLDRLLPSREPAAAVGELALQIEVGGTAGAPAWHRARRVASVRLGMRPVRRSTTGRWVRTGISWRDLTYRPVGYPSEHVQVLRTIAQLDGGDIYRYAANDQWIYLDDVAAAQIWDVFEQAAAVGLSFVQAGKAARPVLLSPEPGRVSLDVRQDGEGLELLPTVTVAGEPVDLERLVLVGSPAHGMYSWQAGTGPGVVGAVTLTRLAQPAGVALIE